MNNEIRFALYCYFMAGLCIGVAFIGVMVVLAAFLLWKPALCP